MTSDGRKRRGSRPTAVQPAEAAPPKDRRVRIPPAAAKELSSLYEQHGAAVAAQQQAATAIRAYQSGLARGLGLDPARVSGFNDELGALSVLPRPKPGA